MFARTYFAPGFYAPAYFPEGAGASGGSDPSAGQLNARQGLLYTSSADIYRLTETKNAVTGEVSDPFFVPLYRGVLCRYVYTQNDDDPTGVGRGRRRTSLDEDTWNAWVGLDIRSGDAIIDVTAGNPNAGTVHRVMGAPRRIPSQGNRDANKLVCQLFVDEKLKLS